MVFASGFTDAWQAMFVFVCYDVEYALHYLFWVIILIVFSKAMFHGVFNFSWAVLRTGGKIAVNWRETLRIIIYDY